MTVQSLLPALKKKTSVDTCTYIRFEQMSSIIGFRPPLQSLRVLYFQIGTLLATHRGDKKKVASTRTKFIRDCGY